MWDTSCPDWEARIRDGRSLLPDLPLFETEADMGLAFFDELRLPDVRATRGSAMRPANGSATWSALCSAHGTR